MNMFASIKATTVDEYIALLPEDRKADFLALHAFIQKTVPTLKAHFASNMVGYGSFPYKNYKKEQVEWPVIALANQKNYISVYVCAVDGRTYIAEKHAKELGNVDVGKSCIRIKKLADVNLPALAKVLKLAESRPGFDALVSSA